MFGFLRKAFRPIASIGQKIGELFRIGRKAEPMGVFREKVLVDNIPFNYMNIPKAVPSQEVRGVAGGFYGNNTSMLNQFKYPN
jgi:hypothetical protein